MSPRAQLHFAITFLFALPACAPGLVTPPAPAKDALPIITVGYADLTGLGPVPSLRISSRDLERYARSTSSIE